MNHKMTSVLCVCACACAASAQFLHDLAIDDPVVGRPVGDLEVKGRYMSANRATGAMTATGGVTAVAAPFRLHSESVARTPEGQYSFAAGTQLTTCSNEVEHLHWDLRGEFRYLENRAAIVKNAWLYNWGVPVFWVPYWYYPMNTDYGLRVLPGYRSRWGGYLLTGYVYDILNEGAGGKASLGGSTYADYRTKNGFAVGQSLRWKLGDLGKGRFKVYHAWDLDADRYDKHWNGTRRRYRNWGSEVDRERYSLQFEHHADFTERDSLRTQASYFSDSWMRRDFFRDEERTTAIPVNEAAYEHRENNWAAGASVSGPLNEFYGGTARLPEGWFAVAPQPVWDLPVNYESQTRAGYLNRNFAEYTGAESDVFRYHPYIGPDGRGAGYQAFRFDTAHRVTVPFKLGDVLSVVPRATYRGTWWSDSGSMRALDAGRTTASGDGIYRSIAEFGFTAAARGTAWLNESWRHTVEPYIDYSFQAVDTTSSRSKRAYIFDGYDGATEWLDQFGFEGRGLPYNWHGVRPGLRNLFQRADERGVLRTVLDTDIYAAVPFDTYSHYGKDSWLRGYAKDNDDPHYSRSSDVVPGIRLRAAPSDDLRVTTRTEYDCENEKVAYSDVFLRHRLTKTFSWHIGYIGRDSRNWDYLPSLYDRYNWTHSSILEIGWRHAPSDWLAYSPYVRHDCRLSEIDEVGVWVDLLTDCLGYRFQVAYENDYRRLDGSRHDDDVRFVFFIYLRAFGPSNMLDLAHF